MIAMPDGFQLLYRTVVGSRAYGIHMPESDTDRMGVCIQPLNKVVGKEGFEQFTENTPEGQITIYALDKWMQLVLKGNPTVTEILWTPDSLIECLEMPFFASIYAQRKHWISKRTVKSHLGYLEAQRSRLVPSSGNHHGRGNPRMQLVEKHGYDTKFAAHAVRLGVMGEMMAREHRYELPLASAMQHDLLSIRRGEWTLAQVEAKIDQATRDVERALAVTTLPDEPNWQLADQMVSKLYLEVWNEQGH